MKSILYYLNEHHGYQSIQPWFSQNLDSMIEETIRQGRKSKSGYRQNSAEVYWEAMGLGSIHFESAQENISIFTRDNNKAVYVSGYDALYYMYLAEFQEYDFEGKKIRLNYTNDSCRSMMISIDTSKIIIPMGEWLDKNLNQNQNTSVGLPQGKLNFEGENQLYRIRFELSKVQVSKKRNQWGIQELNGVMLIRKK